MPIGNSEIRALKLETLGQAIGPHFKCGTCPQDSVPMTLQQLTEHKKNCKAADQTASNAQQATSSTTASLESDVSQLSGLLSAIDNQVRRVTIQQRPMIRISTRPSGVRIRRQPHIDAQPERPTVSGEMTGLQHAELNWRTSSEYHLRAQEWMRHKCAHLGAPMMTNAAERLERLARDRSTTLQAYMRRICLICQFHVNFIRRSLSSRAYNNNYRSSISMSFLRNYKHLLLSA